MNYRGNLQILPLGNVRLFHRIRRNYIPLLKTCIFFAEIADMTPPFWKRAPFSAEITETSMFADIVRFLDVYFFILELSREG